MVKPNATDSVSFTDGFDHTLCTVALSAGSATCPSSALTEVGGGTQSVYNLLGGYTGDGNYSASSTTALVVTVLSAADVMYRNDFDVESATCPIE